MKTDLEKKTLMIFFEANLLSFMSVIAESDSDQDPVLWSGFGNTCPDSTVSVHSV